MRQIDRSAVFDPVPMDDCPLAVITGRLIGTVTIFYGFLSG